MKLIHPLIILRILSIILIIGGLSIFCCIPIALIYQESFWTFIYSGLISGLLGLTAFIYTRNEDMSQVSSRDGYVAVTLSWLEFSLLGCMPYLFSGEIPNFFNAFFESTSGITTTGASILTNIEGLPKSILFWRQLTHWIGGIGIILLIIIILPSLKIRTQQFLTLESSLKEKILPKTKSIGLRLLYVYLILTFVETLLLWLGEMDLFDSVCHAFTTIATGGFSTKNDSIASCSPYTQNVISVFMYLSGISFVLFYFIVKKKFNKVYTNEELWFYTAIVLISGILVSITIIPTMGTVSDAFRTGFFQVISIITTTGLATSDFAQWPDSSVLIIFLLFFTGACAGSTSGGLKMGRILVAFKNINMTFKRLHHPKLVQPIRYNGRRLSDKENHSIMSFVVLYVLIFFLGAFVLLLTGIDPITAVSSSIASIGCVGPALGTAGPMSNFAHFPDSAKLFMSLFMIIGRLELMSVFVLFSKPFWRL